MQHPNPAKHVIVISPNNSLSKRGAMMFFAVIAATCLSVGLGFAFMGFWPVLPFVGLEIFALGVCLGMSMRRGNYREIITITDSKIVAESGVGYATERVEFPRHWSKVELRKSKLSHHPDKLVIRSGVQCHEVASCLTETERKGLWERLSGLVGQVDQSPPLGGFPMQSSS